METKTCKCCGKELPIEDFAKNAWGYTSVCKERNIKNRRASQLKKKQITQQQNDVVNARHLKLHDFTPRELMEELKRRGYEGVLRYVQVHEIDLATI